MKQDHKSVEKMNFLEILAADLMGRYGANPGHLKIILPGKRAGLFLGRAWASLAAKPVWAPDVVAMEEFVFENARMKPADEMTLVFKLFDVCGSEVSQEFTFGQFSGWATTVLRDFNDVDLFLADPEQVFMNLLDAKELSLWMPGDAHQLSDFEQQYILFYKKLLPWYHRFREELAVGQWAYQGMAFRYLAENPEEILKHDDQTRFVFAGFNAFTPSEEKIVRGLIDTGRAEIIWDADEWCLDDEMQEAGYFMRRWRKSYGAKDFRFVGDSLQKEKKIINVFGVNGIRGQARLAGELLSGVGKNTSDTAVVLPDESLLLPVMNAIPDSIGTFNVTMGLSLRHTPALSWLMLNLQLFGRQTDKLGNSLRMLDLLPVVRHPWFALIAGAASGDGSLTDVFSRFSGRYCTVDEITEACSLLGPGCSEFVKSYFRPVHHPAEFIERMEDAVREILKSHSMDKRPFQQGALIETLRILQNIGMVIHPEIQAEEGYSLLRFAINRLAAGASIPFSGEPLEGVQVLGLLETRNLDFQHVILLAVNEGVLPAGKKHNTLIPADIRKHHGLPGWQYHDAIYAYHFYHLLQRADRVDVLYNSDLSSDLTGEMSRFIRQIESELLPANPGIQYSHQQVSDVLERIDAKDPAAVEKTEPVLKALLSGLTFRGLSQSQISHYIKCPLMFFYSFVAGIRETEVYEESFDHRELGILVHEVLRSIYEPVSRKTGIDEWLSEIRSPDESYLYRVMVGADRKVTEEMHRILGSGKLITGRNMIINGVAQYMVRSRIGNDLQLFKTKQRSIVDLEKQIEHRMTIEVGEERTEVLLRGVVDRIDFDHGKQRFVIADYKTGQVASRDLKFDDMTSLLENSDKEKAFQLMFYAWMYARQEGKYNLSAVLFPLKSSSMAFVAMDILDTASEEATKVLLDEFEKALVEFCSTLLDKSIPFTPTSDLDRCRLCPYQWVCMRGMQGGNF